jgi:hypothetical protein
MWNWVKGFIENVDVPFQCPKAVDINGSADFRGDSIERYFLAIQSAVLIVEVVHTAL